MKKIEILIEKYLGELTRAYTAAGIFPKAKTAEKKIGSTIDMKLGVKLAMGGLETVVKGIRANLKGFNKEFQDKVIKEALKKLGVKIWMKD